MAVLTVAKLEADFLTFDGLAAVTYVARRTDERGDPVETKVAIANALRRAVSYRDRQLGIVGLDDVGTVWHFRKKDLIDSVSSAVIVPRRGDTIIASQLVSDNENGDRWAVRSMELQTLATRWRCVCVLGEA